MEENTSYTNHRIFPPAFCPVIFFLGNSAVATSIITMGVLGWMRYYAVRSPLEFQTSVFISRKFRYGVLLCSWILGGTYAIPCLLSFRENEGIALTFRSCFFHVSENIVSRKWITNPSLNCNACRTETLNMSCQRSVTASNLVSFWFHKLFKEMSIRLQKIMKEGGRFSSFFFVFAYSEKKDNQDSSKPYDIN